MAFEDLLTALRNLGGSFHLGSQETPDHPLGAFQLWHRRKAFAKVSETFDRGGDMVQAVQGEFAVRALLRPSTDYLWQLNALPRLSIATMLGELRKLEGVRLNSSGGPTSGKRLERVSGWRSHSG